MALQMLLHFQEPVFRISSENPGNLKIPKILARDSTGNEPSISKPNSPILHYLTPKAEPALLCFLVQTNYITSSPNQ